MVKINDTLDSGSITDSQVDIKFMNGFAFSLAIRIGTTVFAIFGLFAFIAGGYGMIFGPIAILTAIYINSSTYGTEISLTNNYVRVYSTSFGIKKGKWLPTLFFPDITVLKMGKSVRLNTEEGAAEENIENEIFEVFLLTKNHRKRILIKATISYNEAFVVANDISERMDKNLVLFNPTISNATLAKRYDRH